MSDWHQVHDGLKWALQKEPYKMEAHHWIAMKGLSYAVCKKCGLVNLKNELTRWCVKMGCNHDDHPQYKESVKRLTTKGEDT
jgi:hypothetical protein